MSIKNNIATLVSYIWREHEIIVRTVHYTMNVLSIEAELFAIRYDISQTSQMQDVSHIVIITDTIYTTKYIFDMFIHSYQLQSIAISSNLRKFFNKSNSNSISFWNCFSNDK